MNKQEFIETLEEIRANINRNAEISDYTDFSRGKKDAYNNVIGLAKQLDEPIKVVVPKFVAEWLDDLRGQISGVKLNSGALFMVFIGRQLERYYDGDYSFLTEKVEGWLTDPENKVKLMSAIDNGYKVEKEQLYYVDFIKNDDVHKRLILDHENGKHNIADWSENLIGLVQEIFTEQEIKSIDERYWPFAVKVGNE